MKCAVEDCDNEATWRPIVQFFPEGEAGPFTMEIGTGFCASCKDAIDVTVEELLSDEMKEHSTMVAGELGAPKPDFSLSRLEWFPLLESTMAPNG
jgi:hypothetical protein